MSSSSFSYSELDEVFSFLKPKNINTEEKTTTSSSISKPKKNIVIKEHFGSPRMSSSSSYEEAWSDVCTSCTRLFNKFYKHEHYALFITMITIFNTFLLLMILFFR